jgi:hypothetical protein
MIDRNARDRAVELLNAALAGRITNYQLEDQWPQKSSDWALSAVGEEIWRYYDDSPEARLNPAILQTKELEVIKRSILFLSSDREYEWPRYSIATENRTLVQRVFGLGKQRAKEEWERFKAAGEIDAWPFLRLSDYQEAAKQSAS